MTTFQTILGLLIIFIGLPLFIVWLNDKIFHRYPRRCELDEYSKRFTERLLAPQFAELENHFGCAIPEEIKCLYEDKAEIQKGDFEVTMAASDGSQQTWTVAFYEPADLESVRDGWQECDHLFAFANDGCGNEYVINPKETNTRVSFYDHETGEFTVVASSLSEFLQAPRTG